MGSINNLSSSYLQPGLSLALQGVSLPAGTSTSSSSNPSDEGQLSPIAQLVGTLQQLQQSNPTEYQQVIQQIAANLQSAAVTAQADGNSTAANQLNQLAPDVASASSSGQLPSLQDVARTANGHHHHHHHSASPDSTANGTQNDSLDPLAIIQNTLSSAGIGVSTS
jgi:hypothetical protein